MNKSLATNPQRKDELFLRLLYQQKYEKQNNLQTVHNIEDVLQIRDRFTSGVTQKNDLGGVNRFISTTNSSNNNRGKSDSLALTSINKNRSNKSINDSDQEMNEYSSEEEHEEDQEEEGEEEDFEKSDVELENNNNITIDYRSMDKPSYNNSNIYNSRYSNDNQIRQIASRYSTSNNNNNNNYNNNSIFGYSRNDPNSYYKQINSNISFQEAINTNNDKTIVLFHNNRELYSTPKKNDHNNSKSSNNDFVQQQKECKFSNNNNSSSSDSDEFCDSSDNEGDTDIDDFNIDTDQDEKDFIIYPKKIRKRPPKDIDVSQHICFIDKDDQYCAIDTEELEFFNRIVNKEQQEREEQERKQREEREEGEAEEQLSTTRIIIPTLNPKKERYRQQLYSQLKQISLESKVKRIEKKVLKKRMERRQSQLSNRNKTKSSERKVKNTTDSIQPKKLSIKMRLLLFESRNDHKYWYRYLKASRSRNKLTKY
ncbi:hypothetical protein CYY_004302 [Polysphondylium violaceum]|uniref:Uncharacterized protein n=1 Tax=Polysphondylium violaceum TaxID=133409 RepID=A0A8J4PVN1_9MYCE|nr:hypothetical protein CYY_004302 [Polysphondylium violaceum]